MSYELHHEVSQWLYEEADILDEMRHRDWLALLTPDIRYRVPVRVTLTSKEGSGFQEGAGHFDENYYTLEKRVARLETGWAWSEDPPSRTRHFVTNVKVSAGEREDELAVRSSLLLHRTRGDLADIEQLAGQRHDRLRRVDGVLRLAERNVYLDHTTLKVQNLAILL